MNFLCDLLPRIVEHEKAKTYTEEKLEEARMQFEKRLDAAKQEFSDFKKSGEARQVAERRRVSSLISAVKDVEGGYEGLRARWTQGIKL